MADFYNKHAAARDTGNEQLANEAREEWAAQAQEFWKPPSKTGSSVRSSVLHRKKTLQWLGATNHALKVAFGVGWKRFKIEDDLPPSQWPSITIAFSAI